MTTEPAMVQARGLIAGYQRKAVVGPIDLAIRDNDAVAFIGPNGVGKSTLLKTLAGMLPPISGDLTYRGRPIAGGPASGIARRGLVLVGEHRANVLRTLTVAENLELAAGKRRTAVHDLIEPFPLLRDKGRRPAATLSGGELQMLSLAMALALRPRCLLLDEPSAGLAPIVLDGTRQALVDLRASGLAIVVAEQRPDVVRGLCDRVAVVSAGALTFLHPDTDMSTEALVARYFRDDPVA